MKTLLKKLFLKLGNGMIFGIGAMLSIGIFFIVYAAGRSVMTPVTSGSGLSANAWNQMIDNLNALKTTSDGLQTTTTIHTSQITTLQTKDTDLQTQVSAINTSGGCPSGKSMVNLGNISRCMANNITIEANLNNYFSAQARTFNGAIQTRMYYTNPFCGTCDSGWINGFSASCTNTCAVVITAKTDVNGVCYSTTCKTWY